MMTLKNALGLSFHFLENGSVRSIEADPIRISLKDSGPFSAPGTNIFLRKRSTPVEYTALTGPQSNSHFNITEDCFFARGSWAGIDYECVLQLSKESLSWQWQVEVRNTSNSAVELDLIYVQDVGLKPINSGLVNEYYVSQYLERRILEDKTHGAVVCCRQNMKEAAGHPWLMLASKSGGVAACTDGMQFLGRTYRETGIPEGLLADKLGGEYAGESSVIALQENPFKLAKDKAHTIGFIATYLPNHPLPTSEFDLLSLQGLFEKFEIRTPAHFHPPLSNLFNSSPFLPVDDLNDEDLNHFFGKERRHIEKEDDRLLSFFCQQNNHVVLRAKEVRADRPHTHIMQAKTGLTPDEDIMSTTSFAFGVFNSHLTQGNTNFNTLLSICTSQFNQGIETGQRIILTIDDQQFLLGVPSAFEMGLNHCRWIYKHGEHIFQVRTWTSRSAPQVNMDFKVIAGDPVKLLITHDFDGLNGWRIIPGSGSGEFFARPNESSMIVEKFPKAQFRMITQGDHLICKAGGDELLYRDGENHGNNLFILDIDASAAFCMSFVGEVCSPASIVKIENADDQWLSDCQDAQLAWRELSLNLLMHGEQEDIAAIREIFPWYGQNALTHYLTPYGLEQFDGAAWGTRDVSQGPVDLLLTMEKYEEAKQVLRIIFSNQNPDGGWPQWWMFDSYTNIRAEGSHGDVFYWCIIALANYIKVTGDVKILDEILHYYHEKGLDYAEKTPLSEHIDRLIKMIVDSFIPGTALVPFGGGDWNDSLQPVSKELAQRLISSWTVEMNYQAFMQYQAVYEQTGETQKGGVLKQICESIKADFNKYLVQDGIVSGYGLVGVDRKITVLLHPNDTTTDIHFSILPMERGLISEIFTKEQALQHMELIDQILKGPDGARLMDQPLKYKGGIQTIFQRAESSTYFGREIGLMYVHEHIRYAESLARIGKAEAFVKALRQAIPVGYREVVPCGDIRQANCYYSSSDVAFKTRYEADEHYEEVIAGAITLRGGWRVYSSGPGIYIGLVVSRLLGLRIEFGNVIIDPVMPDTLGGFTASMNFMDRPMTFHYSVKEGNFHPKSIIINGKAVNFAYEGNKYRLGGMIIPKGQFLAFLNYQENVVEVKL